MKDGWIPIASETKRCCTWVSAVERAADVGELGAGDAPAVLAPDRGLRRADHRIAVQVRGPLPAARADHRGADLLQPTLLARLRRVPPCPRTAHPAQGPQRVSFLLSSSTKKLLLRALISASRPKTYT